MPKTKEPKPRRWAVYINSLTGLGSVTTDPGGHNKPISCPMPAADAHLIAAAPELLEALKDLWGYVEDRQKSNPGYLGKLCVQDYARLNRALGSAPAAIAKAEGKS